MSSFLIPYVICEVVLALECINCNTAILRTMYRSDALHRPQYIFIKHLSLADLSVALIVAPLSIVLELKLTMSYELCSAINVVYFMFCHVPTLMLFCLTVERFFAIRFPRQYLRWIDCDRANYINLFVWAVCVTLFQAPGMLFRKEKQSYQGVCTDDAIFSFGFFVYFQFTIFYAIPITTMFCLFLYIWNVQRRYQKKFKRKYARYNRPLLEKYQTTKIATLVYAVFTLTSLPVAISDIVVICSGAKMTWPQETKPTIHLVVLLLERLTFVVNPFIYSLANSLLRNSLLRAHCMKEPAKSTELTRSSSSEDNNKIQPDREPDREPDVIMSAGISRLSELDDSHFKIEA